MTLPFSYFCKREDNDIKINENLNTTNLKKDTKDEMLKRAVPSSGELIPVVGLGSWQQFDVGSSDNDREPLRAVLKLMVDQGGKVIDSSPMYGRSESVIGDLTSELGLSDKFFFATKVWTRGREDGISQMEDSARKMKRDVIDLMQVHNLVDWETHLQTLRAWKKEGRVRYFGITTSQDSVHDEIEEIVKSEKPDFVQFNYSIKERNAEKSLLKAALDSGTAVLINEPYDKGNLFSDVKDKKLPEWAAEYDIKSWGQFFLKYIISHPAVTCVIPGTSNPKHLVDNMGAGYGKLPDENGRKKMAEFYDKL
ncbi:MAG: aldo/keto reductase [Ignavibacteriae bacterium]|nr:MAG: aldo/keto reductase [Ignavibacteriota bacterium]